MWSPFGSRCIRWQVSWFITPEVLTCLELKKRRSWELDHSALSFAECDVNMNMDLLMLPWRKTPWLQVGTVNGPAAPWKAIYLSIFFGCCGPVVVLWWLRSKLESAIRSLPLRHGRPSISHFSSAAQQQLEQNATPWLSLNGWPIEWPNRCISIYMIVRIYYVWIWIWIWIYNIYIYTYVYI